MRCKRSETKFSKAAGRDITTCREFDGAADGELGFNWTPKGLHWGWGVGVGAAASALGGTIGSNLKYLPDDTNVVSWDEVAPYAAALGVGVPAVVGGLMACFRATRTAGWATIGTGVAGGLAQYFLTKQGNYIKFEGARYDRDLLGLYSAQRQLMGAGVQVLNGNGNMGLPVAEEVRGAGPVQLLQGPEEVNVYQGANGGFGATFGTSLFKK